MPDERDETFQRWRLCSLLDHFGVIEEPPKVRRPLRELLFLVVAATIADCEDYEEVALWGRNHLTFLRRFFRLPFWHAVRGLAEGGDELDRPCSHRRASNRLSEAIVGALRTACIGCST